MHSFFSSKTFIAPKAQFPQLGVGAFFRFRYSPMSAVMNITNVVSNAQTIGSKIGSAAAHKGTIPRTQSTTRATTMTE